MNTEIEFVEPTLRNCTEAEFGVFIAKNLTFSQRENPTWRTDTDYRGVFGVAEYENTDGQVVAIEYRPHFVGGERSWMIAE